MHQVVVEKHERAYWDHARVQHELLNVGAPVEALVRHGHVDQTLRVAQRLFRLVARARLRGGVADARDDVPVRLAGYRHLTPDRKMNQLATRVSVLPVRALFDLSARLAPRSSA